jgi:hypothetical protein
MLAYWSEVMDEDDADMDFHSTQEFLANLSGALAGWR